MKKSKLPKPVENALKELLRQKNLLCDNYWYELMALPDFKIGDWYCSYKGRLVQIKYFTQTTFMNKEITAVVDFEKGYNIELKNLRDKESWFKVSEDQLPFINMQINQYGFSPFEYPVIPQDLLIPLHLLMP